MPLDGYLATFLATSLLLALTPGPGVMYIVARALAHGRSAGLAAVLGVALGNMICALVVALGIGGILVTYPAALGALRLLGAAYLVYLGLRQLNASTPGITANPSMPRSVSHPGVLREGAIVALSNPKTILFFAAFLPQFMPPEAPPTHAITLGALFVGVALASDSLYALGASRIASWARGRARAGKIAGRVSGALLISLGVLAALDGRAP